MSLSGAPKGHHPEDLPTTDLCELDTCEYLSVQSPEAGGGVFYSELYSEGDSLDDNALTDSLPLSVPRQRDIFSRQLSRRWDTALVGHGGTGKQVGRDSRQLSHRWDRHTARNIGAWHQLNTCKEPLWEPLTSSCGGRNLCPFSPLATAGPGGVIGPLPRPEQRWANHQEQAAKMPRV